MSAQGFRAVTQTGVEVTINTVTRVDFRLEVGAVTETVTVAGQLATLQTDKSDVRHELTAKAITSLPLPNYRNYQSLINLLPRTTPAAFQNAIVDTPARAHDARERNSAQQQQYAHRRRRQYFYLAAASHGLCATG